LFEKYEKHIKILLWCAYLVIGVYVATKWVPNILSWFLPLIMAYLTAWMTRPMARFFNKKWRFPPKVASICALLVYLLFFLGILGTIIARLITELMNLAKNSGAIIASTQTLFEGMSANFTTLQQRLSPEMATLFEQSAQALTTQAISTLGAISQWIITNITGFATSLPSYFFSILIYLLSALLVCLDFDNFNTMLRRWMSKKQHKRITQIKSYTIDAVVKYLRGMSIILVMNVIILLVGFLILGVDYAFTLAIILALLDILPAIGTGIVLTPWAIFSMVMGNWYLGIGLIVLYLIVTFVRPLVEPKIMSKTLGLKPIITVTAAYAGLKMLGFVGLVGMPIITLVIFTLYRSGMFDGLFRKQDTPV